MLSHTTSQAEPDNGTLVIRIIFLSMFHYTAFKFNLIGHCMATNFFSRHNIYCLSLRPGCLLDRVPRCPVCRGPCVQLGPVCPPCLHPSGCQAVKLRRGGERCEPRDWPATTEQGSKPQMDTGWLAGWGSTLLNRIVVCVYAE